MRYRIRTLLILLLIASLPMAWLAYVAREASSQKETVRQLREVGGDLQYWQSPRKDTRYQAVLRRLAGPDAIDRVRSVIVANGAATDALMERTSELDGVVMLVIQRSPITDKGIEHISKLRELEMLDATETLVTDAGLHHLLRLQSLKSLSLQGTQVSDSGIMELPALKNSELINVAYCEAVSLSGARKLERALEGTQVVHEHNANAPGGRDVEITGAAKGDLE